ncbi:hypothetical protein T492DRAFT_139946 [Pavlovales sp. CCMP2436]|nr:hypothetical protein T492DRAFT_139946 [Pavlovales sp. CCMP2436]|mmetsp:Transcript_23924/g.56805  ORF Transcript_23924/g.56805 Transcript_23924/m.56805 type:complete len:255 (+) Transcript_23924:104-868(+)
MADLGHAAVGARPWFAPPATPPRSEHGDYEAGSEGESEPPAAARLTVALSDAPGLDERLSAREREIELPAFAPPRPPPQLPADEKLGLLPVGDLVRLRRQLSGLRLQLDAARMSLAHAHSELSVQAAVAANAGARRDELQWTLDQLEALARAQQAGGSAGGGGGGEAGERERLTAAAAQLRMARGELASVADERLGSLRGELRAREAELLAARAESHGRLAADSAVQQLDRALSLALALAIAIALALAWPWPWP